MIQSRISVRISYFAVAGFLLLIGCSKESSPTDGSHTHPADWLNIDSPNFHGKKVLAIGLRSCTVCHGDDFEGGASGVACFSCHNEYPHPDDWVIEDSLDFHGEYIKVSGWNMSICKTCHGEDYSGGRSGISCITCHPGTPEACNTCHGNPLNAAPPEDTEGNTVTSVRGVGAHQSIVRYSQNRFDCSECHSKPDSLYQLGHVDTESPAEIVWGELAKTDGLDPVWDGSSCSDVYCHGASLSGPNDNPLWTVVDGTHSACGTCHRIPPHGHWGSCEQCHGQVVGPDTVITDRDLHINGDVDF